MLSYHQAACRQLGVEPEVTPEMLPRLDRYEHHYGLALPAAVREWYALHSARRVLNRADYTPADRLNDAMPYPEWYVECRDKDFDQDDPHLLMLGEDGESGLLFAVRTDRGDNPPVLIGGNDDATDPEWTTFADSFGDFVFARAWDWRTYRMPHRFEARYVDSDEIDVALHADGFARLPYFYLPDFAPLRRFEAPRQRISLNNVWMGDWILAADTEDDLRDLVRRVARRNALTDTLEVPPGSCAGTLLTELRSSAG